MKEMSLVFMTFMVAMMGVLVIVVGAFVWKREYQLMWKVVWGGSLILGGVVHLVVVAVIAAGRHG